MPRSLDQKLVEQSRTFEVVAVIALILIGLNLLRLIGAVSIGFAIVDGVAAGDLSGLWPELGRFLHALVGALPTVIYMGGVWSARGMFARVANGELFSEANSKSLADIGGALLYGALAAMVVVPVLQDWIAGEHGVGGVRMEQEALVLAVIGGALLVLGRMMAGARRLQSELDEIV